MKKYYYDSMRNFANEYSIYSVESAAEQAAIKVLQIDCASDISRDIHRISRAEAMQRTAANRAAYRDGTATHNHPAGATAITRLRDVYPV